jgi:hypothetical protein
MSNEPFIRIFSLFLSDAAVWLAKRLACHRARVDRVHRPRRDVRSGRERDRDHSRVHPRRARLLYPRFVSATPTCPGEEVQRTHSAVLSPISDNYNRYPIVILRACN